VYKTYWGSSPPSECFERTSSHVGSLGCLGVRGEGDSTAMDSTCPSWLKTLSGRAVPQKTKALPIQVPPLYLHLDSSRTPIKGAGRSFCASSKNHDLTIHRLWYPPPPTHTHTHCRHALCPVPLNRGHDQIEKPLLP